MGAATASGGHAAGVSEGLPRRVTRRHSQSERRQGQNSAATGGVVSMVERRAWYPTDSRQLHGKTTSTVSLDGLQTLT
jgi:hypothetical protein